MSRVLPWLPLLLSVACGPTPPPPPTPDAPSTTEPSPMPDPAERPEPVSLALAGWTCTPSEGDWPNERWERCTRGGAAVVLTRWFGEPETPGEPMAIASRRPVVVSGRSAELLRTSMFDGVKDAVDVLFLQGDGWSARLVLRGCDAPTVDAVLAGVRLR